MTILLQLAFVDLYSHLLTPLRVSARLPPCSHQHFLFLVHPSLSPVYRAVPERFAPPNGGPSVTCCL